MTVILALKSVSTIKEVSGAIVKVASREMAVEPAWVSEQYRIVSQRITSYRFMHILVLC